MPFKLLAYKNFRSYFIADIIASLGSGITFIGMNWFIMSSTGTNAAVGKLLSTSLIGGILVFPFAGVITDRFPRLSVLKWILIVRSATVLLAAISIPLGFFSNFLLYLVMFVAGAGWSVFISSSRGLMQELLAPEDLIKGSSLIEISLQFGMFTAAALGGFLFKYLGLQVLFYLSMLTYALSYLFLNRISYTPHVAEDKNEGWLTQFKNSWGYFRENPLIFLLGIVLFLPFVVTMVSNVILPGYVKTHIGGDSVIYGLADMSYGIGACLSGFMAGKIASLLREKNSIYSFFILSICAISFLVFNKSVVGLFAGSLCFGIGNSSIRIVLNSTMMRIVPKSFMGRSMSAWLSISFLLQITLAFSVGKTIDIIPVVHGFTILASIMLIALIGAVLILKRLQLNKQ